MCSLEEDAIQMMSRISKDCGYCNTGREYILMYKLSKAFFLSNMLLFTELILIKYEGFRILKIPITYGKIQKYDSLRKLSLYDLNSCIVLRLKFI